MGFSQTLNKDEKLSFRYNSIFSKLNLLLYSPYYAEACNEFAVPISAS